MKFSQIFLFFLNGLWKFWTRKIFLKFSNRIFCNFDCLNKDLKHTIKSIKTRLASRQDMTSRTSKNCTYSLYSDPLLYLYSKRTQSDNWPLVLFDTKSNPRYITREIRSGTQRIPVRVLAARISENVLLSTWNLLNLRVFSLE